MGLCERGIGRIQGERGSVGDGSGRAVTEEGSKVVPWCFVAVLLAMCLCNVH